MEYHLAEINIARLLHPIDAPQIADFVAALDRVNGMAEKSEGFVWRLKSLEGNATDIAFNEYPFILVNMSVWTTPDALKDYVYRSGHVEVFRRRADWFEKPKRAPYCLWWIPVGHTPSVAEGRERLEHYWETRPDTKLSGLASFSPTRTQFRPDCCGDQLQFVSGVLTFAIPVLQRIKPSLH